MVKSSKNKSKRKVRKKSVRKSKARRKYVKKIKKSKGRRKSTKKIRKSKARRKSTKKNRKSKGKSIRSLASPYVPPTTRKRKNTTMKNYSGQNIWNVILWNRPNYWETSVEEVLNIIGQFTPIDLIFLQEVKRDRSEINPIQMRTKSQYNKPISTIYEGIFKKYFLNYEYKMVCAYGQEEKDTSLYSRLYSNELCQISLVEKRNNILETSTIDLNDYWNGLTGAFEKKYRYIRLVLGVKIEKNGREIWWWNLHFPHSHIKKLTNELIRRISNDYGNSNHVILGDFNKDPEFAIPSGWSFHYTEGLATHSKYSIDCGITPYIEGSASIYDYMLTNITDADIKIQHAGKNTSERSDHCPLKITLDFP